MRRAVVGVVLGCILSTSCCVNPPPVGREPLANIPPQLTLVQPLQSPAGYGLLTPISPTQALTAAHMVDKEGPLQSFDSRHWHVQWKDGVRDIAMLQLDEGEKESQVWLTLSTRRPKPAELHYMKAFFAFTRKREVVIAPVVGRFITIDSDKNMVMDCWSFGGMSGGGVLNQRGELVGIVTSTVFPGGGGFRSLLLAADLTGGMR